jgi:RNA polymerase sigma factor (sigma-70 family)
MSDQDADDAIEDACIAFLRFFRPEPDAQPIAWMMTTTKHAALTIRSRNIRLRERDAEEEIPYAVDEFWESNVPDPRDSTEEQVEAREWTAGRADLLAQLKPDQRTALSLLGFGFSYLEIGERQQWSATKVNRCIAEGRKRLRELLAQGGEKS